MKNDRRRVIVVVPLSFFRINQTAPIFAAA
jgi:hypothetical protein